MYIHAVSRSPRPSDIAFSVPTDTLALQARGTFTSEESRCDRWML